MLGYNLYSMERANAEFVVVEITVQNNDTSASVLPPFQLVDKEGRTYDESSAGTVTQGFFSLLEKLNPGVSKRGYIAFDVPPKRQYFLLVSGGIESGKHAIVLLPMSEQPEQQSAAGDSTQQGSTQAPITSKASGTDKPGSVDVASVRRSAEGGDADAQLRLGTLYQNGQGLPQNYEEAYFWISVAVTGKTDRSKREFAIESQDVAASYLTPAQLSRANERVRKWREKHPRR